MNMKTDISEAEFSVQTLNKIKQVFHDPAPVTLDDLRHEFFRWGAKNVRGILGYAAYNEVVCALDIPNEFLTEPDSRHHPEPVKWDGISHAKEITDALLFFIKDEDKESAENMSYGDLGKLLQEEYNNTGMAGGVYGIDSKSNKVRVTLYNCGAHGICYELTWNKAAKLIHSVLCSAQKHTDEIMTSEATPIEKAGFSVKTFNEVKRTFPNAVTLGELKNFISDDPKTLDYLDNATFHELRTVLGLSLSEIAETDTPDSTAVPETVETADTETADIAPAAEITADTETAFDYSLVDSDTAKYLHTQEKRIEGVVVNAYYELGEIFSETQDRLANCDHNKGLFLKWIEASGFKKSSVYRAIDVYNYRQSLVSQSGKRSELEIFDTLPRTLQADISSSSAPKEAVNAVLSGDITTHKDYIALKKELEEAKAWNEKLSEENVELTGRNSSLESRAADLGQQNDLLREENEKLSGINEELDSKNNELELENKELRSQPQDAIIPPDPTESKEYQSLKDDYNKISRLIAETTQENDRLKDKQKELLGRYNELYERAKAAADSSGRELTGYFLPVSVDEYSAICQQLKGTKYAELLYKAKLIKF